MGLQSLSRLVQLQSLELECTRDATDAGIQPLCELLSLRCLSLRFCHITDVGVHLISRLVGLESLGLYDLEPTDDQITDIGLHALSSLVHLQEFGLTWNQSITDTGLAFLSGLVGIKELCLLGCGNISGVETVEVDGAEVEEFPLSNLVSLEVLRIGCCSIVDEGIQSLTGLTRLQELDLGGNWDITDMGIQSLSGLSSLKSLSVDDCEKITDTGVQSLSALLRNCIVE